MRVLVSLTTIPSRTKKILPVLESLLAQTFPFESLTLYASEICVRQNAKYEFPDNVLNLVESSKGRFRIKTIPEDFGPGSKIIPAMQEHFGRSAGGDKNPVVLISVDDDVILEAHAIQELVQAHAKRPGAILGFMGFRIDRFVHAEHTYGAEFVDVDALGGYRAILYPESVCHSFPHILRLLHDEHMKQLMRPCIDDDHSHQCCAIFNGIPRLVVRTRFPCLTDTPETKIVAKLNIRFLTNTDGVSAAHDPDEKITASRRVTDEFFANLRQRHVKKVILPETKTENK